MEKRIIEQKILCSVFSTEAIMEHKKDVFVLKNVNTKIKKFLELCANANNAGLPSNDCPKELKNIISVALLVRQYFIIKTE